MQRFQNEAQAAAALDHPNIVNIVSVGCERGVHYYAMQYIEGRTLAQVIEELRGLSDSLSLRKNVTSSPLSLRERVRVTEPTVSIGATPPAVAFFESQSPANDSLVEENAPEGPHVDPLAKGEGEKSGDPLPKGERGEASAPDTQREPQAAVSTKGSHRGAEFFRTVAHLGIQAAEALEHAHQMGVVHRDVKPSNLIVDARGHLWVTGFGLAMIQKDPAVTMTGDIVGALRYMSPEQALGNRREMNHRTDVYSFGVTLYELLTLQPAFAGDERETLVRRLLEEDPPPPRNLNRAIPRDLETVVLKAIAKEPSQRYATAQQLADELKRILADEPIQARRPTLADRAGKWARRHRPLVSSAVVLLVLCTIGALASALLIAREQKRTAQAYEEKTEQLEATERAEKLAKQQGQLAKQQERLAKEQEKLANAQKEEAVEQRDISDRNLYVAHMRLAQRDWEQSQISRLHDMLDSHISEPGRPDLRGWEWYYYLSLCHSDLLTLRGHTGGVTSVAWSPDGKRLALSTNARTVILHPETGKQLDAVGADVFTCWSPDGTRLALAHFGSNSVVVWDTARRQEVLARRGPAENGATAVAWSPDGSRVASTGRAVAHGLNCRLPSSGTRALGHSAGNNGSRHLSPSEPG